MHRIKANRVAAAGTASLSSALSRRGSRVRLGLTLFRDKGIPFHVKILALTLGGCLTFLMIALEVPIEGVLALAMPVLGVPFDFAIDGLEFFALPVLLAVLILPLLVRARR